ncbi:Lipopolysaccharide export system ATP-binding protein LptB [bacterium HR39]|nr:Lipopolysaccharide export system ATP-binding protein LptB [bacterium HR39]
MSEQVLLRVEGLSKSFGSVPAARSVDLAVHRGEALGIIGPNGAGKSTLFGLIAGDVRPDAGRIVFDGRDITRDPPHRRCRAGIARSWQIPRPFVHLSVYENVLVGAYFGAGLRGREAERAALAALADTGMDRLADRPAGSLTILQRKRLELARALATRPRLLLLDEIAGGLTEAECVELVELIRGLHAQGLTVVWVEHVVHALLAVVQRLVVLDFGELIAEGEPAPVMADPRVQEVYLGIHLE